MGEIILTETREILTFDEQDAYNIIDEARRNNEVEASSVKYKKETGKKVAHYIVTIKFRRAAVEDYVGNGE